MMSRNEAVLTMNLFRLNTALTLEIIPKWFKISFDFHRIAYTSNKDSYTSQPLTFLLLKQSTSTRMDKTKLFYLLGVNTNGYLSLKKISTDYDINQFSFNLPFKVLWSVQNDKINLNQFHTSYTAKIGLKLNENLVEMSINDSFVSRFELSTNEFGSKHGLNVNKQAASFGGEKFQIDGLKFQNFDSIMYLNDTFNAFKSTQSYYFNSLSFLVYDLNINDNFYVFSNGTAGNALKLTILDESFNYLLDTRDFIGTSNLILLNASLDDFDVISYMNRNFYGYCSSSSQRQQREVFHKTVSNQTLSDTISVERIIPEEIINRLVKQIYFI
jgi:hypothetical protein